VINAAEVDVTDFGSGGWTEIIGGLKSGQVSLDFHSDFGAGAVSELFADLVGTIGTVTLIAANGTAASATTPLYTTQVMINSFTPVAGAVGDLSTFSVTLPTSGAVSYGTGA
jgi:predicted secreted protein